MNTNKLLINEPPLQVLPTLAARIGLNEAILLQQIQYWVSASKNVRNGYTWIYNTIDEWQKQFPFWSRRTLIRVIQSLEKQKVLISQQFNQSEWDQTKWYRIDYKKLESYQKAAKKKPTKRGQHDNTDSANLAHSTLTH